MSLLMTFHHAATMPPTSEDYLNYPVDETTSVLEPTALLQIYEHYQIAPARLNLDTVEFSYSQKLVTINFS